MLFWGTWIPPIFILGHYPSSTGPVLWSNITPSPCICYACCLPKLADIFVRFWGMVFPRTKFLLDISYGRWWWSIDWFLSFIIPAGYLHSSFFPFIFYFLLLSGPSLESVNSSPFPVKSPLLVPTQETFVQSPLGYTWCLFPLTYWKYLTIWIYIFLLSPLGAGFLEMIESILLMSAVAPSTSSPLMWLYVLLQRYRVQLDVNGRFTLLWTTWPLSVQP